MTILFSDALLLSAAICSALHNISIPVIDDLNFNLWNNYTRVISLNIVGITPNDNFDLCEEIREKALNCFEVLFGGSRNTNCTEMRKFFLDELNSTKEDLSHQVTDATGIGICHKILMSLKKTDMALRIMQIRNVHPLSWLDIWPRRAFSTLRKFDPAINPAVRKRTVETDDFGSNEATKSSDGEFIVSLESERHNEPAFFCIDQKILLPIFGLGLVAIFCTAMALYGLMNTVFPFGNVRSFEIQRNNNIQRPQMAIELAPVPAAVAA